MQSVSKDQLRPDENLERYGKYFKLWIQKFFIIPPRPLVSVNPNFIFESGNGRSPMIRSRRHRPHNKINAMQRNSYEQPEGTNSNLIPPEASILHHTDTIEIPVQKGGHFSHEVK